MSKNEDAWLKILDTLEKRQASVLEMGGAARLERHRGAGKLDARARIDALFDPGSFREIGRFCGTMAAGAESIAADSLVAGLGHIDGRPALAAVEDFTVQGGTIGDAGADKRYRLIQLASQERIPLVFMLEGAGHRPTNTHAGRRPNDLQGLADLSGQVPIVCLVLGASAGHGALTAPLADFVVMSDQAALFTAGPPLVRAATGEDVSKEVLGGPSVHIDVSGVAHNPAENDLAAIALARRYLSYMPGSAWAHPPLAAGADSAPRRLDAILDLITPDPLRSYRMRPVVELLADAGSVFEIQPRFGAGIITALARLGGRSVAIIANDPSVLAGTITAEGADKAAHFLDVANAFHLPVIFLADNPGVMSGTRAERCGTLRHAARMFVAQHRLRVPKFHVTLRKAFGFGSSVMGMNPFDGQSLSIAFPAVSLGAMPVGGVADSARLDASTRSRLSAEQADGAYHVANLMGYDEVIDPRELRNTLLDALAMRDPQQYAPEPLRIGGIRP